MDHPKQHPSQPLPSHSPSALSNPMASTASSTFACPIPTKKHKYARPHRRTDIVMAADSSGDPTGTKQKPVVDTRIHWSNPDEGWIGTNPKPPKGASVKKDEPLGERFSDLINQSSTSHYQFLGVPAEADIEEIKAAYRRLSKEYHPDTTSLPLKTASEKFMQLREAYNVLSKDNSRQFYDWTLAQEAESRQAERMRMELEDPYEQDFRNYQPVPDEIEGKNVDIGDQAMTALTIDIVIIIFAICCFIYAAFFKEQS